MNDDVDPIDINEVNVLVYAGVEKKYKVLVSHKSSSLFASEEGDSVHRARVKAFKLLSLLMKGGR